MRLMISLAALFLSVVFVQLSSGALGPLDALSGRALSFSNGEIGLLGSAHFAGFLFGCWWAPRLMGSVGHARGFAVFASLGCMGALGHTLSNEPEIWMGLRLLSGACVAGCYTTVESWMQAKADNSNRGRLLGGYRIIDLAASLAAQLMIGVLTPASYVSYNILAILCCMSLIPLALTTSAPPKITTPPRLHPIRAMRLSPLGVAGVAISGITMSAFRMVSPIYGLEEGLSPTEIGGFLAMGLLGGAISQLPVGWLADRYDRRAVLAGLSVAALVVSGAITAGAFPGVSGLYLSILLFGLVAFPLFSVSAAHANDFAPADQVVELNAALMFWYAIGAIASPYVASVLLEVFGSRALFIYIGTAHIGLILFAGWRSLVRAAPTARTPYTYRPRTSFTLQRLFRRKQD